MSPIIIVLSIILLICALFLIVIIALQENQKHGLGGAISGTSSDTYFGKNKSKSTSKLFNKLTIIASVAFVVIAIATALLA